MSSTNSQALNASLPLSYIFPNEGTTQEGQHSSYAYIQLSDFVTGSLFYHPALAAEKVKQLDSSAAAGLSAIIGDQQPDTYFIESIVNQITQAPSLKDKTLRIVLGHLDSSAYSSLIGGDLFHKETNPQLGLRGVSLYATDEYTSAFSLECSVIKILRTQGFKIEIVVPYVRTLSDAAKVIDLLAEQGLPRGLDGLKVLFSIEQPSSALMVDRLLHYFDGVVLNLDSLTQSIFAIDINIEALRSHFDPESEVILDLATKVVKAVQKANKPLTLKISDLATYPKLQHFILDKHIHQVASY
ncbi:phosphoenolpyruvate synthase [Vibrio sp.]|nr:phosphoenolpyruvate synthase [Vibrio sp.]